jgi:hypothetical protein
MARYLIPLAASSARLVRPHHAGMIRDLGPKLYPNNCTDSWRRWVVTPARAVINNAHDKGKCPPIKIKGYSEEERVAQDKKRKKASRIERRPGDWEWLLRSASKLRSATARWRCSCSPPAPASARRSRCTPSISEASEGKVIIPGAKGHADREITIPPELVAELANLKARRRRADGSGTTSATFACSAMRRAAGRSRHGGRRARKAGIDLSPHAAGRHGFGQEHVIRQGTTSKAAGKFGGWSRHRFCCAGPTPTRGRRGQDFGRFSYRARTSRNATGLKLLKKAG